jgi:alpha-1,3-fucosyltransferase
MIESKYKFYLSFENSICPDYVTEKFFRIAQLESVVPVVYGGADNSRIAPPHSYIDARQFEPKQLADYLKKLDADDALFKEYLQWKDKYIVENGEQIGIQNAFCDLCRKLHQKDEPVKVYNQVIDWFHPENTCVIDAFE